MALGQLIWRLRKSRFVEKCSVGAANPRVAVREAGRVWRWLGRRWRLEGALAAAARRWLGQPVRRAAPACSSPDVAAVRPESLTRRALRVCPAVR